MVAVDDAAVAAAIAGEDGDGDDEPLQIDICA
jgi:hypothetical protein